MKEEGLRLIPWEMSPCACNLVDFDKIIERDLRREQDIVRLKEYLEWPPLTFFLAFESSSNKSYANLNETKTSNMPFNMLSN